MSQDSHGLEYQTVPPLVDAAYPWCDLPERQVASESPLPRLWDRFLDRRADQDGVFDAHCESPVTVFRPTRSDKGINQAGGIRPLPHRLVSVMHRILRSNQMDRRRT